MLGTWRWLRRLRFRWLLWIDDSQKPPALLADSCCLIETGTRLGLLCAFGVLARTPYLSNRESKEGSILPPEMTTPTFLGGGWTR